MSFISRREMDSQVRERIKIETKKKKKSYDDDDNLALLPSELWVYIWKEKKTIWWFWDIK